MLLSCFERHNFRFIFISLYLFSKRLIYSKMFKCSLEYRKYVPLFTLTTIKVHKKTRYFLINKIIFKHIF